ncbi:MAG: hypothetical protein IJD92_04470 [Bacilli bacterium]|nr:hypothetical protein [Bacilli bacterium]
MNRKVTFKETVELFINRTIYEIYNETEVPRFNIIFNKEAYELFYEVMNNPFELENGWTPSIKKEDIEFLHKLKNNDCPTLYVKNHLEFFTYLTEITNNLINIYTNYNKNNNPRQILNLVLKTIWLRMGPNDFNEVEKFLKRQASFSKTDLFIEYKFNRFNEHIIDNFYNHKVIVVNSLNSVWDESTKHMSFKILTDYNIHVLPNIYYDTYNDTCYIYAIQNDRNGNKIEEIDKLIYKKYRGNGQPNKIYALKLFINILKEKGIKKIKIPTIQVLNYKLHEIISKKEKESFNKIWRKEILDELNHWEEYEYNIALNWYNHVVDKENIISKIKTEDFINVIYRIIKEDNQLELLNDIDITDTLEIKIKTLKQDR